MEQRRLLAIDPGTKRIGIALSDSSGNFPRPFCIIEYVSRRVNAQKIVQLVGEYNVCAMILGLSTNDDGEPSPSGRAAMRLADEIKSLTDVPVIFWNEHETTQMAKETVIQLGIKKKFRKGHHDHMAAAILLQSFIENNPGRNY
jgi:putative holliday junction resolvase